MTKRVRFFAVTEVDGIRSIAVIAAATNRELNNLLSQVLIEHFDNVHIISPKIRMGTLDYSRTFDLKDNDGLIAGGSIKVSDTYLVR